MLTVNPPTHPHTWNPFLDYKSVVESDDIFLQQFKITVQRIMVVRVGSGFFLHLTVEAMQMFRYRRFDNSRRPVLISLLAVLILLITPIIPTSSGSDEEKVDETTRADTTTPMGDWAKLASGGGWPSEIDTEESFVYHKDPGNELVVIQRGSDDYETWSYFLDNETWYRWNSSGDDPSRSWSAKSFTSSTNGSMAYLYGGYRQSSGYWEYLNILFYENQTWIQVDPHENLTARYWSGMVYDDFTDSVWIFGGRERSGDPTRQMDLFQFNLTHGWTEHQEIGIADEERDQPLMAISPDGKDIYVTLGRWKREGYTTYWHNDIWHFDVERQNWTELNGTLGIPTVAGALFQYRADTSDLILSMGFSRDLDLDNTYIIDPTTGQATEVNLTGGIPPRDIQAWTMKADGRTALVFGDSDGTEDLWSLDIYNLRTELISANPTAAGGSAFTGYDPEDGGRLMSLKYLGGPVWELTYFSLKDREWEFLTVSANNTPTYRDGMANAYDSVENDFYLYGGVRWFRIGDDWYADHYDEFWKLDCDTGNWTKINEHGAPGERGRAAMVIDEVNRNVYVHGGQIEGGAADTLYEYNITGNIWKSIDPTIKPQARREHTLEFHPYRNGFYLFGGRTNKTGGNVEMNDLWFFNVNSELWERLPTGELKPSLQNWAGLSINTDNNELLLFGNEDDETFFWREEWSGWRSIETPNSPGGWSGHGQAYSEVTGTHFIWAGDGTQVWEFNPILRTPALQIQIFNPEGESSSISPISVFPSLGIHEIKVLGRTDLPYDDFLGLELVLSVDEEVTYINWTRNDNVLEITGRDDWFIFSDDVEITFPEEGHWEVVLPLEFTFDVPHNQLVRADVIPITDIGLPESAQRASLFRMVSDLNIVSYQFSTDLQDNPLLGGWLFGRTNLTVDDFRIAFKDFPNISPLTGGIQATFENHLGDKDTWNYIHNTSGELTVPIVGKDKEVVDFYLNLTSQGEVLDSLTFQFKLDLDPPSAVIGAVIRADSATDDTVGYDNDNQVYVTWEGVVESGSGLKGVCYSLDENFWPTEQNLTLEPEMLRINKEGDHTVFLWAIDKTGRVGPYVEAPITIDTHHVYFTDHSPEFRVNSTDRTHTFEVTVKDDISGVDHDSIYYQKSLPDLSFSDWIKYDIESGVSNEINLSITLDLVPGILNLVTFKANDLADNGEWNSDTFVVHYDPTLGTPRAILEEPKHGSQVKGKITLAWDGDYIEPDELGYMVHVIAPDGEDRTFSTDEKSILFTPDIPGEYNWYVEAIAGELRNSSDRFSFFYNLDQVEVDVPSLTIIEKDESATIEFKFDNSLDVDVEVTVTLDAGRGFVIEGENVFDVPAGEILKFDITLNSSEAKVGTHDLIVNVSDEYGRWQNVDLKIRVDAKEIEDDGGEEEGGLSMLMIIIIVVGIIILLAVLLMVFLVLRAKKEESDVDKAPDQFQCKHCGKMISEDDESCPHCGMMFSDGSIKDGEYNPEGVVKKSGEGVDAAVPMAPGMLESGATIREEGSNVMEMELPTPEIEEVSPEPVAEDADLQQEPDAEETKELQNPPSWTEE